MTSLLALVSTAAQGLRTRQWTDMFNVNAARLVTIVFTAGPFFLTAFLTTCIISLSC